MRAPQATPATVLRIILVGFLSGILATSYGVECVGFLVACAVFLFFVRRFHWQSVCLFTILGTVSFWCSVHIYNQSNPHEASVAFLAEASHRVEGVAIQMSETDERQKIVLSNVHVDDAVYEDRVLIFVPRYQQIDYGDHITVRCDLQNPKPFEGFAYDRFLAAKDIYKICFSYSPPIILSSNEGNDVVRYLWQVKQVFIEQIHLVFGEPHGALLAGLLFGEKLFSSDWEDRFIATGTSHVVAASGYNVTVVVVILFGVLTSVGVRRQEAFWILVVGIMAYVVFAGMEAAVVRAGVMGSLLLISRQVGRQASMLNMILLAAVLMLTLNPKLLRDNVGFQLSFLSTIGLVYFAPFIEKRLQFMPTVFGIRESFTSTIAATVATMPVVLVSFGRVAPVGLIANLIILPLIPHTMAFGAVAIMLSFLSTHIAVLASGPAWALLSIMLFMIRVLTSFS